MVSDEMTPELRRTLHAILDAQAEASRELRASRGRTEEALRTIGEGLKAQDRAIDVVIAGNRLALELFDRLDSR